MRHENPSKTRHAIGPEGRPVTLDDLPPADIKRWVMYRKAEVVAAVRGGRISRSAVCRRYRMSLEEFLSWERLIDRHGVRGLRATRLQAFRRPIPATGTETTSSGPRFERGPTDRTTQRPKPDSAPAPGETAGR